MRCCTGGLGSRGRQEIGTPRHQPIPQCPIRLLTYKEQRGRGLRASLRWPCWLVWLGLCACQQLPSHGGAGVRPGCDVTSLKNYEFSLGNAISASISAFCSLRMGLASGKLRIGNSRVGYFHGYHQRVGRRMHPDCRFHLPVRGTRVPAHPPRDLPILVTAHSRMGYPQLIDARQPVCPSCDRLATCVHVRGMTGRGRFYMSSVVRPGPGSQRPSCASVGFNSSRSQLASHKHVMSTASFIALAGS